MIQPKLTVFEFTGRLLHFLGFLVKADLMVEPTLDNSSMQMTLTSSVFSALLDRWREENLTSFLRIMFGTSCKRSVPMSPRL